MATSGAEMLLEVWERAAAMRPAERSLDLARLAGAGEDIVDQPLATRDRWLLELRTRWFGRSVEFVAICPSCADTFEFGYDLEAADPSSAPGTAFTVTADLGEIPVRWPTSGDLLALDGHGAPEALAIELFKRCIVSDDQPAARDLCSMRQAASKFLLRLAEKVGQAVDLLCGTCGHRWTEYVDIAFVLWREIERSAERLLDDVHRLASAYHWTERDILALGRARRRFYLDAVG